MWCLKGGISFAFAAGTTPKDPSRPFAVFRVIWFLLWAKRFAFGFRYQISILNSRQSTLQVFVRAFDSDERLVGVAFMDVGVYVTSLRTLKNLLLIGDAVKSVMFVAFQVRIPAACLRGRNLIFHSNQNRKIHISLFCLRRTRSGYA